VPPGPVEPGELVGVAPGQLPQVVRPGGQAAATDSSLSGSTSPRLSDSTSPRSTSCWETPGQSTTMLARGAAASSATFRLVADVWKANPFRRMR
jgi:hypothetical protein